ncbi:MAG: hypothetical protein R6U32_00965 [Candidatus Woesearchaeota archaeon]
MKAPARNIMIYNLKMRSIRDFPTALKGSYQAFAAKPLYILSSFFVDILFFLLFGIAYSFFGMKMMESLIDINTLVSRMNEDFALVSSGAYNNTVIASLMEQQHVLMEHLTTIAISAAWIILITYILWCMLQGINWHSTAGAAQKKRPRFTVYLRRFSLLNLVWLLLALLAGYGAYKLSVYNTVSRIMLVSQNTINYLMLAALVVIFYFAVVSYVLAGENSFGRALKGAFALGVRKADIYGFLFLLTAIKLAAIYLIISLISQGFVVSVLLNLVLMLPVLSWSRLAFVMAGSHAGDGGAGTAGDGKGKTKKSGTGGSQNKRRKKKKG